jgi:hypothetical protein
MYTKNLGVKKTMSYQGWKNYETWCVALWIDNEEGLYHEVCDMVHSMRFKEMYEIADTLKDYIEEMNPLSGDASMWSDLLGAALSEVDWIEIAEHYKDDEEEEIEDD